MNTVFVNGDTHHTDFLNVFELLNSLNLTKGRFAVEINGELVPKSRLSDTLITDGIKIEVVQAVGGG